jgi:hypothetical protein
MMNAQLEGIANVINELNALEASCILSGGVDIQARPLPADGDLMEILAAAFDDAKGRTSRAGASSNISLRHILHVRVG